MTDLQGYPGLKNHFDRQRKHFYWLSCCGTSHATTSPKMAASSACRMLSTMEWWMLRRIVTQRI